MKIYGKTEMASFLDGLIFALPAATTIVLLQKYVSVLNEHPYDRIFTAAMFVLFISYIIFNEFKPKNKVSIGMKIMNISIYTSEWTYPTTRYLLGSHKYRTSAHDEFYIFGFRLIPRKKDIMQWYYYQIWQIGIICIENSVYDELSEKARAMEGDFARNMTDLYITYLEKIYLDL
jgi:hypothetical protein